MLSTCNCNIFSLVGQGASVHVPAALQRGVQPAPVPLGAHGGAARREAGPVPARLHLRQPGEVDTLLWIQATILNVDKQ